jgi:nitrogen fixation NifU-like protein
MNLEDLYRDIILDHYRSPRNAGRLSVPPAHLVEAFNPLCGDELELFIEVNDGVLTDIKLSARGCSISQASASLMGAALKSKSIDEVRTCIDEVKELLTGQAPTVPDQSRLSELSALSGVAKFPARIKCALMAWSALSQGLDEISAH